MIRYQEALDIIRRTARRGALRDVALAEAAGGVAGAAAVARIDVPGFANAALDGYAFCSADAAAAATVSLRVNGRIAAGAAPPAGTPRGTAWEIATGAPLPPGCDAVAPYERVRAAADGRTVEVPGPVLPGANRREAGEDFRAGTTLLEPGDAIGAEAVMGLAAAGCTTISMCLPPRLALIVTGDELAGTGSTIRDSNGPWLVASARAAGLPLTAVEHVGDDPQALAAALARATAAADLVVTTGGVSAGPRDFVPAALTAAGATLHFHKVAIRPGKPLAYAGLPAGQAVFALPGNPVAVAVGWRFFVTAWLRGWFGQAPESWCRARVESDLRRRAGLTFFAKAHTRADADGILRATILPGQESFKVRPLMQANCWAIVADDAAEVRAGELVDTAPLRPGGFPAPAAGAAG